MPETANLPTLHTLLRLARTPTDDDDGDSPLPSSSPPPAGLFAFETTPAMALVASRCSTRTAKLTNRCSARVSTVGAILHSWQVVGTR
ncbi:Os12g0594201 [Oryza sativa Japonica Group]|uniref:Os12g0594201 protein n=1 Tax=Oryza sativa subsp. japonica TaxID=39947 RepID=A0A0P0YBS0_ORYSJ|nr:hypothetical protein EE612_060682 [Oryza sativa]BAT17902.1 Os12g0594201 [Oryza sativa Japonica Group]